MIVVGIHARAGTGKDELAEAFRRRGFAICAFMDLRKTFVRDVWNCDPDDLWGPPERQVKPVPGNVMRARKRNKHARDAYVVSGKPEIVEGDR